MRGSGRGLTRRDLSAGSRPGCWITALFWFTVWLSTLEGVALLNRRDASLVWCPSSNRFLFGRTREREEVISVRHLLLGSDSPLTAAGDLLDEVRIAHDEVGIPSRANLSHVVSARRRVLFDYAMAKERFARTPQPISLPYEIEAYRRQKRWLI